MGIFWSSSIPSSSPNPVSTSSTRLVPPRLDSVAPCQWTGRAPTPRVRSMSADEGDAGQGEGEDRRQFERVAAHIEVRFGRADEAARALRAYSLNFSVGGLCLKTQRPYEIGDRL